MFVTMGLVVLGLGVLAHVTTKADTERQIVVFEVPTGWKVTGAGKPMAGQTVLAYQDALPVVVLAEDDMDFAVFVERDE